jgi:hypothetical protein
MSAVPSGAAATFPIDDPEYFRSRAEEARTVAEQINDPEAKRMMMGYEVLARRVEARRPKHE